MRISDGIVANNSINGFLEPNSELVPGRSRDFAESLPLPSVQPGGVSTDMPYSAEKPFAVGTEKPFGVGAEKPFVADIFGRASFFSNDGDRAEFNPSRARNSFGISPDDEVSNASPLEPKEPCSTCESRRYVDGSSDASVSYQTPTKINPQTAAVAVAAHEREHITNERANALRNDREIIHQSVSIKYAICPECNVMYPTGGTARTVSVGKSEENKPQPPEMFQAGGQE